MKRGAVLQFLKSSLQAMLEEDCQDLFCPGDYIDEQVVFDLEETCEYISDLEMDRSKTEGEIDACDWQDFALAFEFLRVCRQSELDWPRVAERVNLALKEFLPNEQLAYERLSLWDLLMHGQTHSFRIFNEEGSVEPLVESPDTMTSLVVNGRFPDYQRLNCLVEDVLRFFDNRVVELSKVLEDEPEVPSWAEGDYEFLSPEDQPADGAFAEDSATKEVELNTFEELQEELANEWQEFMAKAYEC